jgi:nitrogen-specific signal transduction histidine kinase
MAGKVARAKDDPVLMISHDLRNELGGIVFVVGHLIKTVADDEVLRSATVIKEAAAKMARLLDELLAHVEPAPARNVTRQAKR